MSLSLSLSCSANIIFKAFAILNHNGLNYQHIFGQYDGSINVSNLKYNPIK